MPTAAAVYCRISEDREGSGLGVARQREDCLALAERRGWSVAGEYVDNDVGAWSGRVRPAYRRLLDDIAAGAVDAVVVWHLDRLHRSPRELEEFFEVCDRVGLRAMATVTGDVDLATDDGRFLARIMGAVARKESDDKSRRLRRKAEELAHAGKVGGGGTRPYGYEPDRLTVVEVEAALIREAAGRVLAGEAVGRVCREWTERGLTTVTGTAWRTTVLRRILMAPRTAGLRELRGEVVGEAEWPRILTREQHERLRAVLTDPARRKGGRPREYLLTGGLAVCGLCGHRLSARPKGDRRRAYVCAKSPEVGLGGCGKLSSLAEPLEDEVRDQVLAALDGPGLREALTASEDDGRHGELLAGLQADEGALDRLDVDLDDGLIDRRRWLARTARLRERIDATRRDLGRVSRAGVLHRVPDTAAALAARWEAEGMPWRRALVAAVVEEVRVGPAVKGRNFFDPERVAVVWRT